MEKPSEQNLEKTKKPWEKLRDLMSSISREVNNFTKEEYGVRELVDERGSIDIDRFIGAPGYSDVRLIKDKEEIYEREVEWSGARDEGVRKFYASEYGAETERDIVRIHSQNKEREKNGQMEMFVAALFHKILKDDFLIVRASAYDDYVNGIDTVMVNKKTGDIICAFDEVHDHEASDRAEEKIEKIKKKVRGGGSTLSYGVVIENEKMVRKEIKNLPVFFLSLSTTDLEDVLKNMNYGIEVSEKEIEIFNSFLSSLENQKEMLLGERISHAVRMNLTRFDYSLAIMRHDVGLLENKPR